MKAPLHRVKPGGSRKSSLLSAAAITLYAGRDCRILSRRITACPRPAGEKSRDIDSLIRILRDRSPYRSGVIPVLRVGSCRKRLFCIRLKMGDGWQKRRVLVNPPYDYYANRQSSGVGSGLRGLWHLTHGQHERGYKADARKHRQNNQGEGVAQVPRNKAGYDDGSCNGHAERGAQVRDAA